MPHSTICWISWSKRLGREVHGGDGDWQPEPARSGAAGVEVDDALSRLDLRHVGVAGNDHVEPGCSRIEVEVAEVMDDVDRSARERHHLPRRQSRAHACVSTLPRIAVTGRDLCKPRHDVRAADVAGVDDVLDARERLQRLGRSRPWVSEMTPISIAHRTPDRVCGASESAESVKQNRLRETSPVETSRGIHFSRDLGSRFSA